LSFPYLQSSGAWGKEPESPSPGQPAILTLFGQPHGKKEGLFTPKSKGKKQAIPNRRSKKEEKKEQKKLGR